MSYRIITISREYGSGGRTIGKKLAEKLGIKCYDSEIISKVAVESGLSENYIEEKGELGAKSVFENYFTSGMYYAGPSLEDKIWNIQNTIIRDLAEKEPCVIVGRCADFILRERKDVLKVFLHASKEKRAERLVSEGKELKNPEKFFADRDRRRAAYVLFYTDKKWGESRNYDLTLDTGAVGDEKAVELLANLYQSL